MDGRARVLTAVGHKEPDRVPITFDCEAEVKVILKEHFKIKTDDELWKAVHADTREVQVTHHFKNIGERPGGISTCFWGYGTRKVKYDFGYLYEIAYHPLGNLNTVEEIEAYPWPTVDETTYENIKTARQRYPDVAVIADITHGCFFNATFMRGLTNFLMDMAENPALAKAILGKITHYMFPAVERLCSEAGPFFDIYYMADDFCTAQGPMISVPMFREYVKPYLQTISDILHKHQKKFLLHVCGSVRKLMPELIEAGVDILEPIQTTAVGMEPEGLKRDFGKDITFYGSVDILNILRKGNPGDVRNEVLNKFRLLGNGGGFILGPSHTYIQPDAPLENILAMYKTAYENCYYPKSY